MDRQPPRFVITTDKGERCEVSKSFVQLERIRGLAVGDWQIGIARRAASTERPPSSMRMTDSQHLMLRRGRQVRHLATELYPLYSRRDGALAGPNRCDATDPGVARSRPPILALDSTAPHVGAATSGDRAWPASHGRVRGETIRH